MTEDEEAVASKVEASLATKGSDLYTNTYDPCTTRGDIYMNSAPDTVALPGHTILDDDTRNVT